MRVAIIGTKDKGLITAANLGKPARSRFITAISVRLIDQFMLLSILT